MDSISLLDILHQDYILSVFEYLYPKDISSLRFTSKHIRQCLESSVKWGCLLKRTEHYYCSIPLEPIADNIDQYLEATQTIFIYDYHCPGDTLWALHASSTLFDFLSCIKKLGFNRKPVGVWYIQDGQDKYVETSKNQSTQHLNKIWCSDILVSGAHIVFDFNDYENLLFGVFGLGYYKWSSSFERKLQVIDAQAYRILDMRFSSLFMKPVLSQNTPKPFAVTEFPFITSYLMSGRRWILTPTHHIYWTGDNESNTTLGLIPIYAAWIDYVYVDVLFIQFESILQSKIMDLQIFNQHRNMRTNYCDEMLWSMYEELQNTGIFRFNLGRMSDYRIYPLVEFGYDKGGYILSCWSVKVTQRHSTLHSVMECLYAMAHYIPPVKDPHFVEDDDVFDEDIYMDIIWG